MTEEETLKKLKTKLKEYTADDLAKAYHAERKLLEEYKQQSSVQPGKDIDQVIEQCVEEFFGNIPLEHRKDWMKGIETQELAAIRAIAVRYHEAMNVQPGLSYKECVRNYFAAKVMEGYIGMKVIQI